MSSPVLIPVLVRERCLGHVIERGHTGFEAFDAAEQSLGTFATAAEAVAALIAAASSPEDA
jgi:hypothetical protein